MKKTIYKNELVERAFLICPYWITPVYFILTNSFPNHRVLIFALFVLILGETHFAATWLFFSLPENRNWFKRNQFKFILVPAFLLTIYGIYGYSNPSRAALLGSALSAIHVTRQSIGIARLYGSKRKSVEELGIYIFSALFLGIGFLRFFVSQNFLTNKLGLNVSILNKTTPLILVVLGVYLFLIFRRINSSLNLQLAVSTGVLLYFPYCFVNNSFDAVAIGVGMHWCQYLALTYAVYVRKNQVSNNNKNSMRKYYISLFIFSYAIITTSIITKIGSVSQWENSLLVIPLILQAYHYYLDAFIWKFSDPDIRKNIGGRLFIFSQKESS